MEKNRRKLNIIIKGAFFNVNNLTFKVEMFLQDTFGSLPHIVEKVWTFSVKNAKHNNKSSCGVRILTLDIKRVIMKIKKFKLEEKDIYIGNNFTKKKRNLTRKIRDTASDERKAGRSVMVRYNRLSIDSVWHCWNEERGKLERSQSSRTQKQAILKSPA